MVRSERRRTQKKPWVERIEDHDGRAQEHAEEGRRLDEEIAEKRMELYRLEQARKRRLGRSVELAREGRSLQHEWHRDYADHPQDPEVHRKGYEKYQREYRDTVLHGIEASGDPAAPDIDAGRRRLEELRYGAHADHQLKNDPKPAPREPYAVRNLEPAAGQQDEGGRRQEGPPGSGSGPSPSRRRVGPTRGRPGGTRKERDDDRRMEP